MMSDEELQKTLEYLVARITELGQRCAQLEAERDAAQAKLAFKVDIHLSVVSDLKGRLDKAEARLSKCKFCGQDVAEGAGGHTSGCYERKLNKVRAALAIDDCTAMTDAIEEALKAVAACRGREVSDD
jgi:hypothetical protein